MQKTPVGVYHIGSKFGSGLPVPIMYGSVVNLSMSPARFGLHILHTICYKV